MEAAERGKSCSAEHFYSSKTVGRYREDGIKHAGRKRQATWAMQKVPRIELIDWRRLMSSWRMEEMFSVHVRRQSAVLCTP